jgi:hypothetical protein
MGHDMRWITGLAALGMLAANAAHAQTTAESKIFAPISPPTFDADLLKTPQAAAPPDAASLKIEKSGNAAPAPSLPKGFDLGKYQLEFDSKNSRDAAKSGLVTDSGETANLSKLVPGQKQDPVLPNYFGLKLSAPTR